MSETHFQRIDNRGYLWNASTKEIQPEILPIVDEVIRSFAPWLGSLGSLRLRGSMSIGTAVLPHSDVDLLLFSSRSDIQRQQGQWTKCRNELESLFKGKIDLVDLQLVPLDVPGPFVEKCIIQARLHSVWLCGSMRFPMAPVSLCPYFYELMWGKSQDELQKIYHRIERGIDLNWSGKLREPSFWCRWAMRDVLRMLAGQITMITGVYTSHLDSCVALISEFNPSITDDVNIFRKAEMFPPVCSSDVLKVISQAINVAEETGKEFKKEMDKRGIENCKKVNAIISVER